MTRKSLYCSVIMMIVIFPLMAKYLIIPGYESFFSAEKKVKDKEIEIDPSLLNIDTSALKSPFLEGNEAGKLDCTEEGKYQGYNYENGYEGDDATKYDNGYDSGYFGTGCEY